MWKILTDRPRAYQYPPILFISAELAVASNMLRKFMRADDLRLKSGNVTPCLFGARWVGKSSSGAAQEQPRSGSGAAQEQQEPRRSPAASETRSWWVDVGWRLVVHCGWSWGVAAGPAQEQRRSSSGAAQEQPRSSSGAGQEKLGRSSEAVVGESSWWVGGWWSIVGGRGG